MGKRRAAKKATGKNSAWLRGRVAKGDLSPIYFLHGPEDLEKDEAVKALIDAGFQFRHKDIVRAIDLLVNHNL
mgnify:CR=1 FL=1